MKIKLPTSLIVNSKNQSEQKAEEHKFVSIQSDKSFSDTRKREILKAGQLGVITIGNICKKEGISPNTFFEWSRLSFDKNVTENKNLKNSDERHRIVLEGNNGECSVAELCKRENISQDEFLAWSKEFLQIRSKRLERERSKDIHTKKIKNLLISRIGKLGLEYFESYIDVTSHDTIVNLSNIECLNDETNNDFENLVCLLKVNDVRFINKHFENINNKMPLGGVFIGCFESLKTRRDRSKFNKIPILNNLYFGVEFFFKRIIPKLKFTKKQYFNLTKGKDRFLSKAECLGRLVSCGFKIMDYKAIDGLIYFVVKKIDKPKFDMNPSYGPIFKMPRIGKNGKIIKVYKFRTMHPYSEYIQDYVLNANGYAESGKPANDFRVPNWGKFFRKFWIDELPQLINVLKGEMKLVGIRPVSQRYFQDIPKEMQKLRLTQKPGCIPPYVALNRKGNVMSVLQAEKEYLEEKIRNPYTTDIKYFFKAIFNIVINHKRSA